MSKEKQINYYKKQISDAKDIRKIMLIMSLVIVATSIAAGLGLGALFSSIPKVLMISLAIGGICLTYPVGLINKANIKIEDARDALNAIKRVSSGEEKENIYSKVMPKELDMGNKYNYQYDGTTRENNYNNSNSKKR